MIETYTEEELHAVKQKPCEAEIADFDEPAHLSVVYDEMKEAYRNYCFLRDLYIDLNRRSGEKEEKLLRSI